MENRHSTTSRGLRSRLATAAALLAILLLAAAFRYYNLNWDEGQHIHPDERFLTMVETALSWPKSLSQFFDSSKSPLSPYNKGFNFFAYGILPLFIVKWLGIRLHRDYYGGIYLVGRAASGTFDLLSVVLVFLIGAKLYRRKVGLLAAALYAMAVMPIQQSHFFTVDNFGTFFALLTFYLAIFVSERRSWLYYVLAGLSYGAAVACKINLATEIGVLLLAAAVPIWRSYKRGDDPLELKLVTQRQIILTVFMLFVAALTFRTFQPYAFDAHSFLDVKPSRHWIDNMKFVKKLMAGDIDYPPGHQWARRTHFWFPWKNMVIWGMGISLGLTVWLGWLVAAYRLLYRRQIEHLLPVAWAGGLFFYQGLQFVESMRYLLPIYPILILLGSWFLLWLVDQAQRWSLWDGSVLARFSPKLSKALVFAILLFTFLWAMAFMRVYRRPLTRIAASRWMFRNIPKGSVIANEHWDDPLPLRIDGHDPFWSTYKGIMMANYDEDTPKKREKMIGWLNQADYIVLSSDRLCKSIPRLPMRYPMTTLYYQALFDGKLGFHLAAEFTSPPGIFGLVFNDESAEEAFHVYDHPYVRIFKKGSDYSEKRVREILGSVDLSHVYRMWPKQVSAAPDALLLSSRRVKEQESSGTWSSIFHPRDLVNRIPVLVWLLLLELLGLVGFGLLSSVVDLPDRGWGLSKAFGWLVWGYLVWLGASVGVFPATRAALWATMAVVVALAGVVWVRADGLRRLEDSWRSILAEEALFLAIFLFFLWLRWLNPDLWHPARGGEKPMDFAFLNAIIKSRRFPPYDPWFSGGYVNYYYFGFVLVGMLTKLSGIVPAVSYNLAVPSLAAITGVGAYSVALALMPESFPRGKKLLAALLSPAMLLFMGNLGEFSLLWSGWQKLSKTPAARNSFPVLSSVERAASGFWVWLHGGHIPYPNDWWFWNATRIVKETINEFPYFSFLFADLHAHVMALPFTLLALGLAVALAKSRQKSVPAFVGLALALSLSIGALRAMNTWDYPTYLLLGVVGLALYVKRRKGLDYYGWLDVVWGAIGLAALSTFLFFPFVRHYATAYTGIQLWKGKFTKLSEFLTVWGFFVLSMVVVLWSELSRLERTGGLPAVVRENAASFLISSLAVGLGMALMGVQSWLFSVPILAALLVPLFDRNASVERVFALAMAAWGGFLLVSVEIVRLKGDVGRMNTVFKFYLQVWVLWSVALAAYAPRAWREMNARLDRPVRWFVAVLVSVLFLAGLAYPVFATPARVHDRFDVHAPHTLNGEAYMRYARYSERGKGFSLEGDLELIRWMRAHVVGTPVILEARAPLYHWGSRISVYTGLPVPLGWDWHEKQQRSVIPGEVIDQRAREVTEMYNTVDLNRFMDLARYYRIRYVVVGALERAFYSPQGLAKFERTLKLFRKVYDNDGTELFEVLEK